MCQKYYQKCKACGGDVHLNFFCNDCLKKIDPWGCLQAKLDELKILREQMKIIKAAFTKSA